jgi:hypothetical protein
MRSSVFRNCLRYRYMEGAAHLPKGTCCDTRHDGVYPPIDKAGLHMISGCSRDGHRTYIHDSVVFELHRLLKYAGSWSVREPRGVFHTDLPDNNKRPDILIRPSSNDLANSLPKFLDVVVSCPIQGSKSGRLVAPSATQALHKGKAAHTAYSNKINHYGRVFAEARVNNPEDSVARDPTIVPFALESTGFIHSKSIEFLREVADQTDETHKLGSDNLMTFFVRSLSFAFQRAIGTTLSLRSAKLCSHFRKDLNPCFFPDSIVPQVPYSLVSG